MDFEKGYIFHVYNQGNNQNNIFFNRENYKFFLLKIKTYINPYADIMAWCLMPNHFHLLVYIKELELTVENNQSTKTRTLNNSIAIMLRSYTRAINKQQRRSGNLFRQKTKAICVNCPKGITPSFRNNNGKEGTMISKPELQYPQICFNYIHQNPVKSGLVSKEEDWEFSSASDYAELRQNGLINFEKASDYLMINK